MSIFKKHPTSADRSASDRRRHKEKIERAIKDGLHDIITNENIIGESKNKKIKIPVKGIKEYKFIYGENSANKQIGSAKNKDISQGQTIGKTSKQPTQGDKAGNEAGAEWYEVEISLEELAGYLFDEFELPDLDKKRIKKIFAEKSQRHGYRSKGIRPRLDKKETIKKKIKRKLSLKRHKQESGEYDENERVPFHEDDLRYKHIKPKQKESSNAVVFFIMDVSYSMNQEKKFLAKSFDFLVFQFIKHKYQNVDLVFISHDTVAKEVNEHEFFTRGNSGGTLVSSGLEKCQEIINQRYHPEAWNIYVFQASDGDNWSQDMDKTLIKANELVNVSQLFCYVEIIPTNVITSMLYTDVNSRLSINYQQISNQKFKTLQISSKKEIWPSFKELFGTV
tara:strand:+ start:612 stop:1790 length:1179 start_codon:yes stop_codon:yes gene_type:complete